ncbi:MAG TPA: gluconate 2-dehydrogenase subunit 3 family protein, partial [Woeseiaceae bacterium]|nr:gluconate 2-dehydrogenase subunit 3 family protein [Woeseiaceae bacterium]
PPFLPFYRTGSAALEASASAAHQARFAALTTGRQRELVSRMARERPPGWPDAAPPAPFFYFVLRNDALDVTYGTTKGFEDLGIPYRAHIPPPSPWGA